MKRWRLTRWPLILCLGLFLGSYIPPVKNTFILLTAPLVRAVRMSGQGAVDSIRTIAQISELARENGKLKSEINELTAQAITLKELAHENELLRKELQLTRPSSDNKLIAAHVISRTSSVSSDLLTINKGQRDGFVQGMPIMAQGFLIGRVKEVLSDTATIELITSSESLLPVVMQQSRSVGLLRGGTEGLIVDEIPRDVTFAENEAIITANLGDVVQSGIPVGTIATVLSNKSDVFQSVRVHSPIDFSRLELVFGVRQ
jgi:rod shape-determining protein MreC